MQTVFRLELKVSYRKINGIVKYRQKESGKINLHVVINKICKKRYDFHENKFQENKKHENINNEVDV